MAAIAPTSTDASAFQYEVDPKPETVALQAMMSVWIAIAAMQLFFDLGLALAVMNDLRWREIEAKQPVRRFIELAALPIVLISVFILLSWVHKAARNSKGFGARETTSPGLAVGWYFIPGASLVMPYVTMQQIWKVSLNPHQWRR